MKKDAAATPPSPKRAPRRRPSAVRVGEVVGWFGGVVCTYWLYWLIAVPLIEPGIEPASASFSGQEDAVAARNAKSARKQTLEQYFPPGSWELENPAIWETNQALLLFKDPKPLPDGTVELLRFTLLFFPQPRDDVDTANAKPIVMRAADGATLRFDQPIVLKTVDLAKRKLVGGQLKGLITISREPTVPGGDDALLITTRDVELQGNRAFSPHVVKFRYGQSHGSGRDLEIFLDAEDGGALRNSRVKSLHLKRDVVAYLALDDPALARDRQAAPRPELQGSMLKITCQGEFRFDFQRFAASFHERVDVERSTVGPSDLLNGEVLTVYLRRRSDEAALANRPAPTGAAAGAGTEDVPIRSIEARGDPVVLQSPSRGVYVRCHRSLQFHPLPGNPFGRLVATGPGVMRGVAPGDPPADYQVQWTREVRFEPAEGEQYVASLRGGATVRVSDLGEVTAGDVLNKDGRIVEEGRIVAWVTPISQPANPQQVARVVPASVQTPLAAPTHTGTGATPPNSRMPAAARRTLRKPVVTTVAARAPSEGQSAQPAVGGTKWQIDRVMAQGNVEVDVPQLDAMTRKLEVWIDRPKQTAVSPSTAEPSPGTPTEQPPGRESKTAARQTPSQRFEVRSGSVQARLIPRGEQYEVAALTLENKAHLQELSSRPGTKPMVVDGQRVHVVGANTEQTRVTVSGRPAQIEAGGMVLLGDAIHLEKHTNRLWIDGAGRMIMPIDQDLNGQPLAQPQSADVSWQGAMRFQTNTVTFERDVRVQSNQQVLTTQRLEGVLDRAIDFSNPGNAAPRPGSSAGQDAPQLAFVRCYGEALLDSREFNEQGQKTAVDQMQVFDLSINRTTGEVHGKGPGWVRHVGRETGGGPMSRLAAPGANVRSAKPAAQRPGLTYLHVQFQRAIHGNINGRRLTFGEPTKTVYAPVSDWNAKLSSDNPANLGPEGMILDAKTLTVREMPARTPGQDGWFELVAIGNVLAEGAQFAALGHRVTYTQDKDQMILEGDGRSPAEVSYSAIEGGRRNEARADKIIYAVGLRHIIFSGAHSLNVDVPRRPDNGAK